MSELFTFWKMLTYNNGNVFNASNFDRSLGVSVPTITKYLHFLEEAFLVHRRIPFLIRLKNVSVNLQKYISGIPVCFIINQSS